MTNAHQRSSAQKAAWKLTCRIGLHAWRVVDAGTPFRRLYTERCKGCGRTRKVRWLT